MTRVSKYWLKDLKSKISINIDRLLHNYKYFGIINEKVNHSTFTVYCYLHIIKKFVYTLIYTTYVIKILKQVFHSWSIRCCSDYFDHYCSQFIIYIFLNRFDPIEYSASHERKALGGRIRCFDEFHFSTSTQCDLSYRTCVIKP